MEYSKLLYNINKLMAYLLLWLDNFDYKLPKQVIWAKNAHSIVVIAKPSLFGWSFNCTIDLLDSLYFILLIFNLLLNLQGLSCRFYQSVTAQFKSRFD